jgi:hypothetical protein
MGCEKYGIRQDDVYDDEIYFMKYNKGYYKVFDDDVYLRKIRTRLSQNPILRKKVDQPKA